MKQGLAKRIHDRDTNFEPSLTPPFPDNMLVEVTNACNHRCTFCGHRKMIRKTGIIDPHFMRSLQEQAYKAGIREVGYYTTGEPFLCPDLPGYIEHAKTLGYRYVYITTNGSLATPEKLKRVFDSGLDSIKFSINAGTSETYTQIHGRNHFEKALAALKFSHAYRSQTGKDYKLYASFIINDENRNEQDLLRWKISDFVDELAFIPVRNHGGMSYAAENGRMTDLCSRVFKRIHVTWEGYLTACCIDFNNYLVVADLNAESLREAWHNESFQKLRERHIGNALEGLLCFNCRENVDANVTPFTAWALHK